MKLRSRDLSIEFCAPSPGSGRVASVAPFDGTGSGAGVDPDGASSSSGEVTPTVSSASVGPVLAEDPPFGPVAAADSSPARWAASI